MEAQLAVDEVMLVAVRVRGVLVVLRFVDFLRARESDKKEGIDTSNEGVVRRGAEVRVLRVFFVVVGDRDMCGRDREKVCEV